MSTPRPSVTSITRAGEVQRPGVEHVGHADGAQERALLGRAGRGDHRRTGALGELHGGEADAAAAACTRTVSPFPMPASSWRPAAP